MVHRMRSLVGRPFHPIANIRDHCDKAMAILIIEISRFEKFRVGTTALLRAWVVKLEPYFRSAPYMITCAVASSSPSVSASSDFIQPPSVCRATPTRRLSPLCLTDISSGVSLRILPTPAAVPLFRGQAFFGCACCQTSLRFHSWHEQWLSASYKFV